MTRKTWMMTAGALLTALAAETAMAQTTRNCAPRNVVLDRLAETYGETRQGMGLGAQGAVVEIFASDQTGSWTITVTTPQGLTCLVASGQSYETLADSLPPKGDDA